MYSFFGLFFDPFADAEDILAEYWPDCDVVEITEPFPGYAVRFSEELYRPEEKDIPAEIVHDILAMSAAAPGARFVVLRTECNGEDCTNWGHFIQGGGTLEVASGKQALRRLILKFGADIGEREIFPPVSRDFDWNG